MGFQFVLNDADPNILLFYADKTKCLPSAVVVNNLIVEKWKKIVRMMFVPL
jgi:hypothetical protein